eukprot:scaffold4258_cov155-Cylindrotheca_fusiformis.AAC.3
MHPPLDRPHPDCQEVVDDLRNCHATNSKLKFWACNDAKSRLDQCFKEEKQRILLEMNKGFEERRLEEDALAAVSTGKNMSFEEYLKTDKEYQQDMEKVKNKGWFSF